MHAMDSTEEGIRGRHGPPATRLYRFTRYHNAKQYHITVASYPFHASTTNNNDGAYSIYTGCKTIHKVFPHSLRTARELTVYNLNSRHLATTTVSLLSLTLQMAQCHTGGEKRLAIVRQPHTQYRSTTRQFPSSSYPRSHRAVLEARNSPTNRELAHSNTHLPPGNK